MLVTAVIIEITVVTSGSNNSLCFCLKDSKSGNDTINLRCFFTKYIVYRFCRITTES